MPDHGCPGRHLPSPGPGLQKIRWDAATSRIPASRIRVIEHTCSHCDDVVYELCSAGGAAFLRRLENARGQAPIFESSWTPTAQAVQLWRQLLAGKAR